MVAFGSITALHADLVVAPDAPSAPVSLAQATAQSQAPAATLAQATEQAKPSTVTLGVMQEQGIRMVITTQFTPEEIDRYSGFEGAFAEHAAKCLESENPADVAAVAHLVHSHPEVAEKLAGIAPNYKVHKDIKKALSTSKRPPVMTLKKAAEIAKNAPLELAGMHLAWGLIHALNAGSQEYEKWEVLATHELLPVVHPVIVKCFKDATDRQSALGWSKFTHTLQEPIRTAPKTVLNQLPRAIAVGVGTAALSHVALREFDERVGDPLPCPPYDPKGNNRAHEACKLLKMALRDFVVPMAISTFVVARAIDKTTEAIQDNF